MRRIVSTVALAALVIGGPRAAFAGPAEPPAAKPPKPAAVMTPKDTHGKPPAPKPASQAKPAKETPKPKVDKPPKPAPFVNHFDKNPALASRLRALLPPGMTLDQAATGFKNQGQFIAALHVSRNLNIPFADLKARMIGTPHESLGRAIQDLKPGVDSKRAAKLAEFEGKVDVEKARRAQDQARSDLRAADGRH
jgi:hypothetical protein